MSASSRCPRGSLALTLVALASLAAPGPVAAQAAVSAGVPAARPPATPRRDCFAEMPASVLRPTVAHLTADDLGEGAPPLPDFAWPHVRAVSDRVAATLRSLLGATRGALPERDSTHRWREFMGHVHVVVRRDGSMSWSYPWGAAGHRAAADSTRERGVWLVTQALTALRDKGTRVAWPDGLRGDSVAFRLRYVWPDPREGDEMGEMPVAHAAPVLRLDVPPFTPMRVVKRATIAYPESSRLAEVRTTITMQFELDTAGRVVEGSLRDRWPTTQPRPAGKLANYYDEFLQVVRRGILTSTYEPARFGGCKVPQVVEQDFTFGLRGRLWNDSE